MSAQPAVSGPTLQPGWELDRLAEHEPTDVLRPAQADHEAPVAAQAGGDVSGDDGPGVQGDGAGDEAATGDSYEASAMAAAYGLAPPPKPSAPAPTAVSLPVVRTLACVGLTLLALGGCAKLDPFGAHVGRVQVGSRMIRSPYLSTVSYFGYLDAAPASLEAIDGRPMQPVYVWLPNAAAEIGVRIRSPSRAAREPDGKEDFATQGFLEHKKDRHGFDPAVSIERCAVQVDPTDIDHPCLQWLTLGRSEAAPTPLGGREAHEDHDRAELRLTPDADDAATPGHGVFARGVYRVGIADVAHADAVGTFYLQLGVSSYLDGAVMAPTLAQLAAAVRAQASGPAMQVEPPPPPVWPAWPVPAPLADSLAP